MIPYWFWSHWFEWKYLVRRAVGYFVRGQRGWATHDVWGLDHYLSVWHPGRGVAALGQYEERLPE